jgi:hypothetical protein
MAKILAKVYINTDKKMSEKFVRNVFVEKLCPKSFFVRKFFSK